VEKWRSARLKAGKSKATTNRDLNTLKAALRLAVRWRLLAAYPLGDVKQARVDTAGRVRFLAPDEESRLRKALDARDDARRAERDRANAWRRERGYEEWPAFGGYTDHLTPIVLLALNTGLRRGELFNLRWRDLDLGRALLTVEGEGAKSNLTRHVPLNTEAIKVLRSWRGTPAPAADAFVFPGAEGERLEDIKGAWLPLVKAAKVQAFTFHDCRHSFASKLVMAGVDLNTVRELLGHADLKMTLRYAHLAPEHKAAAVAKLVRS
jgi:integrase